MMPPERPQIQEPLWLKGPSSRTDTFGFIASIHADTLRQASGQENTLDDLTDVRFAANPVLETCMQNGRPRNGPIRPALLPL
jgi:hypothetical protein